MSDDFEGRRRRPGPFETEYVPTPDQRPREDRPRGDRPIEGRPTRDERPRERPQEARPAREPDRRPLPPAPVRRSPPPSIYPPSWGKAIEDYNIREQLDNLRMPLRVIFGVLLVSYSTLGIAQGVAQDTATAIPIAWVRILIGSAFAMVLFLAQLMWSEKSKELYWIAVIPDAFYTARYTMAWYTPMLEQDSIFIPAMITAMSIYGTLFLHRASIQAMIITTIIGTAITSALWWFIDDVTLRIAVTGIASLVNGYVTSRAAEDILAGRRRFQDNDDDDELE